ncbi:hypothetical protein, partial [Microseira sp. BLCC-F43]|uniref:hypothetical protein n=1 Tax=Microseira sp. BLCC-F43 TaxID=3153602 RepID=UPI0035BA7DD1
RCQTPLEISTSVLVRKLLNVSRVVERGEPARSDSWNHRPFRAVRMSTSIDAIIETLSQPARDL